MYNTQKKVIFLFLTSLLSSFMLLAQNAEVQPKSNSPYSRFGLGDPSRLSFAHQGAMAGLGAAFHDPYHMNLLNPAALGYLNTTDLETGFYVKYSGISDGDTSANLWGGNLGYFAIGFPLINPVSRVLDKKSNKIGLGMGFVLQPFTDVGYDLRTEQPLGEVGRTLTTFKGSGGTYRLMWGNGFRYQNFSAGVNIGYLFGKSTFNRTVEFLDVGVNAYTTNYFDEQSISAFVWNAGTQFSIPLQKKPEDGSRTQKEKSLVLGIYGNNAGSFSTNDSRFHYRLNSAYSDRDTILLETESRNKGVMPSELTIGVSYFETNKLKLGVEFSMVNWSVYTNELRNESLTDTRRIAAGIEFIPDAFSYNNYWQRVRYRGGLFYRSDPRTINGSQLTEYGITAGLGIPVILPRQQTSFINVALEAGRFGAAVALRETYVRMVLGFTLNDNTWFFKRKFN